MIRGTRLIGSTLQAALLAALGAVYLPVVFGLIMGVGVRLVVSWDYAVNSVRTELSAIAFGATWAAVLTAPAMGPFGGMLILALCALETRRPGLRRATLVGIGAAVGLVASGIVLALSTYSRFSMGSVGIALAVALSCAAIVTFVRPATSRPFVWLTTLSLGAVSLAAYLFVAALDMSNNPCSWFICTD